jgi:hypothetical protein
LHGRRGRRAGGDPAAGLAAQAPESIHCSCDNAARGSLPLEYVPPRLPALPRACKLWAALC